MKRIGVLAKRFCDIELELAVYRSNAGFYIGTYHEGEPFSRESEEYWLTEEAAQSALDSGKWTQRIEP